MEDINKLVIADANTLLRDGLRRILHDGKDFSVVGEASNDAETLDVVGDTKPDALLLDLAIPKLEAVPILLAIKEQGMKAKVLILSLEANEEKILTAAKAGARGYILKSASAATLAEAVREIARGRIWVDRQVGCADMFALLAHRANISNEVGVEVNPLDVLSKRELETLYLIARGLTNEQISKKLFISVPTVKVHLSHVFTKLNVENRTQAALKLMQARLRDNHELFGMSTAPARQDLAWPHSS